MNTAETAFSVILPRIRDAKEEIGECPHRSIQFSEDFCAYGENWSVGAIVGRNNADIYLKKSDFGILFRWHAVDVTGAEKNLRRALAMIKCGEVMSLMISLESAEMNVKVALANIRRAGIRIEDTRD